jgi:hypothetical protein
MSVSTATQHRMVGWLANNELEMTGKEVAVAL